jgi:protein gp37
MATKSTIEWTQTTWNPVTGCTRVSEGCRHCYAERLTATRLAHLDKYAGLARMNPRSGEARWTGQIRCHEDLLDEPYRWRSPRLVFVNSMSDLFHDDVPLDFILKVFRVMNECPRHTFQVLTKRPAIAAKYSPVLKWTDNIWMGTSVENMLVSHRIADLREAKARVRFLSLEPLLGPFPRLPLKGIHWVIVGGESGPGARPMDTAWARQIRDRCVGEGVPFFFKQWGGVSKKAAGRLLDGRKWDEMPQARSDLRGVVVGG